MELLRTTTFCTAMLYVEVGFAFGKVCGKSVKNAAATSTPGKMRRRDGLPASCLD